ncbi:MerR family transcriptional regulator [Lacisediminihabitans sp. H27-G8]|uniref:MerR family transcriptional regulator n=1 Tax=Lacisediminihabitans sp. H27-G8 TaxID=3111909 RepID=UPI0038FC51BC
MGELTGADPGSLPTKLTYSIREVSLETGLSISALRYYETARLLTVPRSSTGQREYSQTELNAVKFIHQLRRTGMPIARIREYADLVRAGDDTTSLRMSHLEQHRDAVAATMTEQQGYLDAITRKIDLYRRALDRPISGDNAAPPE